MTRVYMRAQAMALFCNVGHYFFVPRVIAFTYVQTMLALLDALCEFYNPLRYSTAWSLTVRLPILVSAQHQCVRSC